MPTHRQSGDDPGRPTAPAAEPIVRVGVILDSDARAAIEMQVPDRAVFIECTQLPADALVPRAVLTVNRSGDSLAVRVGGRGLTVPGPLRLSMDTRRDVLASGEGMLVRDVVAGRGFHWRKLIDQTLPGTIEVAPGANGLVLINELPLEDYLAGVITAEMSGDCPADLLKAQCVVARSWLLAMTEPKHDDDPFDRCNDDCCQRYQGTGGLTTAALDAVGATRGEVLLTTAPSERESDAASAPRGRRELRLKTGAADERAQHPLILDANYSKCCGGISELARYVWGADKPGISAIVDAPSTDAAHGFFPVTDQNLGEFLNGDWLRDTHAYCSPNVVSPADFARYLGRVDETDDYFRWTVRYNGGEFEELLRQKLLEARDLASVRDVRVTERGVSGRAARMNIEWRGAAGKIVMTTIESEYEIRRVLHAKFLYSSAIAFHMKHDSAGRIESLEIRGAGWGHGAGMCQIGALGMALSGVDYKEICRHYYPEAHLSQIYD